MSAVAAVLLRRPLVVRGLAVQFRVLLSGMKAPPAWPWQGIGQISGTVKEKSTPVNTPLARRVVLLLEPSLQPVAETVSDAGTGAYIFQYVSLDKAFSVVAYDHLLNYRAEIANNLTFANGGVELMP
jgi:hypothetical protein